MDGDTLRSRRWLPLAWLLLVAATCFAYRDNPRLGFTDMDALANYAAARVEGPRDLLGQLVSPLTGGVASRNANFYRPVSMLQFALLRGLFGPAAAGWQLWDLALHLGVVGLVAWTVAAFGAGAAGGWVGWLAAATLALHPLGAEVVPAVARSPDLLMAGLVVAALVACLKRRWIATAVLWVLALAAKETALAALPVLLGLWLARHGRVESLRLLGACSLGLAVYVGLRTWVLGGLGGYHAPEATFELKRMARCLAAAPWESLLPGWTPQLDAWIPRWLRLPGGLAWIASAGAVGWASWRRGNRLPALGVALWLLPILLFAATGNYSRRLLYLPTAGVALALASLALRSGPMRPVAWLLLLSLVPASPLLHRYRDWRFNGDFTRSLTTAVESELDALPAGAVVWIVDRCVGIDADPLRYRLWRRGTSLNNCAALYSIQAWADDRFGPGRLRFLVLSETRPKGPVPPAGVYVSDTAVTVERAPMSRETLRDPDWDLRQRGDRFRIQALGERRGEWLLIAGGPRGRLVQLP